MLIKTTNYDRSSADAIDESIAIKDIARYHLDESNITFKQFSDKFGVPSEAIITEGDTTYINLSLCDAKKRRDWVGEKKRIKEIRFSNRQLDTWLRGHAF